jgi:hypothetical protein
MWTPIFFYFMTLSPIIATIKAQASRSIDQDGLQQLTKSLNGTESVVQDTLQELLQLLNGAESVVQDTLQ